MQAQYASPIPRTDAHETAAANCQAVRPARSDGCCPPVVTTDIWFALDTGSESQVTSTDTADRGVLCISQASLVVRPA